jgi:hypothetical protein
MPEANEIQVREVDLPIVSDHFWSLDTKCPHCQSYAQPELIEPINERFYETVADLMLCTDCQGLFLVVEFPFLLYKNPIMTRWKIPDKIK